jgi:hypothetical protein
MSLPLHRTLAVVQLAAIAALSAYAVHARPGRRPGLELFENRLYYALVATAAVLTIARAVLVPLHCSAWIALRSQ